MDGKRAHPQFCLVKETLILEKYNEVIRYEQASRVSPISLNTKGDASIPLDSVN
jgi:hypothetical protein